MKRAYIKCPLSAALAAKDHGFIYHDKHIGIIFLSDLIMLIAGTHPLQAETMPKLYLFSGNMPLLEPMVGDLLHARHDERRLFSDSFFILPEDFNTRCHGWTFKIIQRNGKSFPEVEYEEVAG